MNREAGINGQGFHPGRRVWCGRVWSLIMLVTTTAIVHPAGMAIEGIWRWHVIDKTTGEMNRHGDGQRGCDVAMSAGDCAYAFAFLHQRTGEPVWLDRAKLLTGYYWDQRNCPPLGQLVTCVRAIEVVTRDRQPAVHRMTPLARPRPCAKQPSSVAGW